MNISKSQTRSIRLRAVAIGIGIIYYFAFLICYYQLISPVYSYTGMTFFMLPDWAWIVSIILSLMPLLWMPIHFKRPSDFASWFIYLCLVFPANIIIFMVSSLRPSESVQLPISITASFILFEFVRRKARLFEIPKFEIPPNILGAFLAIVTIMLSLFTFAHANFEFRLSFADVYMRRLEARSILSSSFARYSEAFLASVCVPITFFYGIQRKKWLYIAMSIFALFAIFSLKGSKGALLSPVVLGAIYFLASRNRSILGLKILIIFTFLTGLSLVEPSFFESNILASYVIRRKLVVPSHLTTYYWEFFLHNPFVMMKDSVIGWFIPADTHYFIPRARLIGFEYFGNIANNANANIWAASYADFGYLGMAITSILAGLTLRLIDSLGVKDKFVLASVCSAFIGLVWSEAAFYTSFLSNGVLMLIIILWLYPSRHSHGNV